MFSSLITFLQHAHLLCCSQHALAGPQERPLVGGAHPRGARGSWPADRGGDTGCGHRGEVCTLPAITRQRIPCWSYSSTSFHSLRTQGVTGRDVTPFVLRMVNALTKGKSLQASILLNQERHQQKYLPHISATVQMIRPLTCPTCRCCSHP